MRFALLEIKLTLTKLLRKYDLVASEKTPKKVVFKEGFGVRQPTEPIHIMFKRRQIQT
jgi:hypothetical protein